MPMPRSHPNWPVPPQPRRVLPRCLLILALAMPAVAHPISLTQLLRLPLEVLLRLNISTTPAAPAGVKPAPSARPRAAQALRSTA